MNSQDSAGPVPPEAASGQAAALVQEHKTAIMNQWLDAVIDNIPAARDKGRAELADHLLDLLEDIVDALLRMPDEVSPGHVRELEFIGVASSIHGRERASVEGFTASQVLEEYILLRQVITGYCKEHKPNDAHSVDVINRVIEFASLKAVNEFVQSIQEIQEKLIGTLMHDIRTPLSVTLNYAELLTLGDGADINPRQAGKTIMRNTRRVMTMLESLLDALKVKAGGGLVMRFKEVDLCREIRTLCREVNYIYTQEIATELPSTPVVGVFDSGLIVRTMENLISNAIKYGDKRSPIVISLEDCGAHVQLNVHNKGEPIAEADVKSIFRFFSSGERRGRSHGWGLGLALIKTVAESHGGEVLLESSREHGTTFGMTLYKANRQDGEQCTMLLPGG